MRVLFGFPGWGWKMYGLASFRSGGMWFLGFSKQLQKVGDDDTAEELNKCPQCGGDADNGHDRCYPPTAYLCSKCSELHNAKVSGAGTASAGMTSWAFWRPIGELEMQNILMKFDPATGEERPYPSHAAQWREWHGGTAWLFDPWTGRRKQGGTKRSTLETMLKHSRKKGLQRSKPPLPKHGNETFKPPND